MKFIIKTYYFKILITSVLSVMFFPSIVVSQTHQIVVTNGSSVQFIVATYDQYLNGITLTPSSSIKVRLMGNTDDFWALTVYAESTAIYNNGSTANIPLNNLELTASTSSTNVTGNNTPYRITDTSDWLVKGDGASSVALKEINVTISYKLNGSLLNKPADSYFVSLYFQLKTRPTDGDWTFE